MYRRMGLYLVAGVLLATVAQAGTKEPSWRGSGGWGAGMPYASLFDATRLIRVAGEVARIERVVPQVGMAEGYALVLRSRDQLQTVHLGPVWFLERQDYSVEAHEEVEIVGSRVSLDGQPVIVATVLITNGRTLQLRDAEGLPVWSSWRRTQ